MTANGVRLDLVKNMVSVITLHGEEVSVESFDTRAEAWDRAVELDRELKKDAAVRRVPKPWSLEPQSR